MLLKVKEYILYKGDQTIAVGTIRQIAKQLNISEASLRSYRTPTYMKRVKNGKRLVVLEEERESCSHVIRVVLRRFYDSPKQIPMYESKTVCEACNKVLSVYVSEAQNKKQFGGK